MINYFSPSGDSQKKSPNKKGKLCQNCLREREGFPHLRYIPSKTTQFNTLNFVRGYLGCVVEDLERGTGHRHLELYCQRCTLGRTVRTAPILFGLDSKFKNSFLLLFFYFYFQSGVLCAKIVICNVLLHKLQIHFENQENNLRLKVDENLIFYLCLVAESVEKMWRCIFVHPSKQPNIKNTKKCYYQIGT